MKRIEYLVRQEDSGLVIRAMEAEGATAIAVSPVAGVGVERVPFPGHEIWERVEAVVGDGWVAKILDRVGAAGVGAGRVMVSPVEISTPVTAWAKVTS